jgi:Xaa-Pro aminopeptidase
MCVSSRIDRSTSLLGIVLTGCLFGSLGHAAEPAPGQQGRVIDATPGVLPLRARIAPVNEILTDRLENLLPRLMREAGIDMWLVINREYVEDPVYLTLVPEPVFAARRTTMLVFFDRGPDEGIERLTVSRYEQKGYYEAAWEGGSDDDQWLRLGQVIAERDPKRIGINTSVDWPFGDGLTASLKQQLEDVLSPALRSRLVSAESLAVRWLETRTERELEVWPQAVALARSVIGEAFSNRVITPGVTTTDDVAWYIRERFADLNLDAWFMPYVNLQRAGAGQDPDADFFGTSGVIERGDVLHTDVGICYLRLCTDTQEMGYVLRAGESDVPHGLEAALASGNQWQDVLTSQFVTGRTGNQILDATASESRKAGLKATTYTHPLGFHGHAAGPTVGMWDNQGPTPVRGDWPLRPMTGYAIEGNVRAPVPEWNGEWVQIKLEQSAYFDGQRVIYLAGRQTGWHVVR